ncbi:MAG: GTPase Era [Chitinophagales bacterium]|nr:GTPase Era [Bacteroidota bacterium]MCB9043774.1 GTPase Era [Chitinophagales bacterium]
MAHENFKAGFVNILGKPNAGKSTLLNLLVGERLAIVTQKAQTTRHRIVGIVNEPDCQIIFSDTPGIIQPKYQLQSAMMKAVMSCIDDTDVLLLVVSPADQKDSEAIVEIAKKIKGEIILVFNKTDLLMPEALAQQLQFWQEKVTAAHYVPVSALQNKGIDIVKKHIVSLLPLHPPYFQEDALTDRTERFFVSEIIREKILLQYAQEIPYSVEVVIDAFKEKEELTSIRAEILVNRNSQKAIIIGKGGESIKKLGIEARKDIEKFLDTKVFLELFVKVAPKWRENAQSLKKLGYDI